MASIQESKEYGKFSWHKLNRDTKIGKIYASMKEHGWIDAYPAHAVQVGGKIKIKAGHHRCEAAMKLGLPIKYVLCNDTADIFELERSTNPWTLRDFVVANARAGKSAYVEVLEYHEKTGIALCQSINLHLGSVSAGSVATQRARSGDLKLVQTSLPARVSELVSHMRKCGVRRPAQQEIVSAIATMVQIDDIDVRRLKSKIKSYPEIIQKCSGMSETFRMMEDLYNRRSTSAERVPVAFLCEEFCRDKQKSRQFGSGSLKAA